VSVGAAAHILQRTWKLAANQLAIKFGERFTNAIN
jgi:hypothetical protein